MRFGKSEAVRCSDRRQRHQRTSHLVRWKVKLNPNRHASDKETIIRKEFLVFEWHGVGPKTNDFDLYVHLNAKQFQKEKRKKQENNILSKKLYMPQER